MKFLLIVLCSLCTAGSYLLISTPKIDRTIKGTVLDATNQPIIGATILAKSATTKTTTDYDGRFSIAVPETCKALIVSFTGYVTQEVNIKGLDSIRVTMAVGDVTREITISDTSIPDVKQDMDYKLHTMPLGETNHQFHAKAGTLSQHNSYQAPMPTAPPAYHTEDYSAINENTFHTPQDAPLSTFSIDVDKASYSNVRRFLNGGQHPPVDAVRIEEMINYFDYEYVQPVGNAPISIAMESGECPWNPQHKLVHIGLKGRTIPMDKLPPSNLVFLIDVSGSMNSSNKLPLVIESFKILTEQLRQQDRVAIVVYAGSSGLVLASTSGSNKESIKAALERLTAGGSTAGAEGIQQAYNVARENFIKGGNNRVILATDGDFNVGISSDGELVRLIEKERESGVFLSIVGYGMGNYMDNKMQELADHGNGNHSYVDDISEAKKVFVHEFGGTLFTIAKDVKIQVEFNPSLVAGYRLIGYENRMLQNEDFNNDKKDAGEIGSGHTVTALYEIIPAGIESPFLTSVDELKYQQKETVKPSAHHGELMTVKFRYKEPDGETSKLIEQVVMDKSTPFNATSENFRWSAAVASFGMLLRNSGFSGKSSFADVEKWASSAIGSDKNGYRKEFLKLVKGTDDLTATEEASR